MRANQLAQGSKAARRLATHRQVRLRLRRLICGEPAVPQAGRPSLKYSGVKPDIQKGRTFSHIGRQSRDFLTAAPPLPSARHRQPALTCRSRPDGVSGGMLV